jgi:hypothetical protein
VKSHFAFSVNLSGFTAFIIRLFKVWTGSSLDCDSRSSVIIVLLSFFLSIQNSSCSWDWLCRRGFHRQFAGVYWQIFVSLAWFEVKWIEEIKPIISIASDRWTICWGQFTKFRWFGFICGSIDRGDQANHSSGLGLIWFWICQKIWSKDSGGLMDFGFGNRFWPEQ